MLSFISENISKNGIAAVLLPFHRTKEFETLLSSFSMFVHEKLIVRQTSKHDFFRTIFLFSKTEINQCIETEIVIRDENNNYTMSFTDLLKDYYLAF